MIDAIVAMFPYIAFIGMVAYATYHWFFADSVDAQYHTVVDVTSDASVETFAVTDRQTVPVD